MFPPPSHPKGVTLCETQHPRRMGCLARGPLNPISVVPNVLPSTYMGWPTFLPSWVRSPERSHLTWVWVWPPCNQNMTAVSACRRFLILCAAVVPPPVHPHVQPCIQRLLEVPAPHEQLPEMDSQQGPPPATVASLHSLHSLCPPCRRALHRCCTGVGCAPSHSKNLTWCLTPTAVPADHSSTSRLQPPRHPVRHRPTRWSPPPSPHPHRRVRRMRQRQRQLQRYPW